MSWTWNSHTYSLTHSNVICWCARNTFGLIWKMTLLRSYGHTLPNFDGLLQFFFSMGPRYTRSLTNTISSTPMKMNSKFFLSQVQLSSSWISDTVILFVAFYWTSLSCNSFNAPYFVQWLDEIDRRNRCWLLWTRLLKSDN